MNDQASSKDADRTLTEDDVKVAFELPPRPNPELVQALDIHCGDCHKVPWHCSCWF